MQYGLPWSENFVRELSDKELRDEFVADQIRTRVAMLIRALREQPDRNWSQIELGRRMGTPQNVISRLEDPDYGKMSLQTLLEVAAAFDLPLWIDIPEWEEWFGKIRNVPNKTFARASYDADKLAAEALAAKAAAASSQIRRIGSYAAVATASAPAGKPINLTPKAA
jgi:transcriptional regulator with XRE-family HTH domain